MIKPDIFEVHSLNEKEINECENIRKKAKELVDCIDKVCPDSREKSLSITNLEQSIMWATKSIAINK